MKVNSTDVGYIISAIELLAYFANRDACNKFLLKPKVRLRGRPQERQTTHNHFQLHDAKASPSKLEN